MHTYPFQRFHTDCLNSDLEPEMHFGGAHYGLYLNCKEQSEVRLMKMVDDASGDGEGVLGHDAVDDDGVVQKGE